MGQQKRIHHAFILMFFACAGVLSARAAEVRSTSVVTWQPAKLVRGSPVLFQVRTPAGVSQLSGKWLGHEIKFEPLANRSEERRVGKECRSQGADLQAEQI